MYTETKFQLVIFQTHFFLQSAYKTEIYEFWLNMCILMDLSLLVFRKRNGIKKQKSFFFFLKKKGLSAVFFYRIGVQTGLAELKNTKHLKFAKGRILPI